MERDERESREDEAQAKSAFHRTREVEVGEGERTSLSVIHINRGRGTISHFLATDMALLTLPSSRGWMAGVPGKRLTSSSGYSSTNKAGGFQVRAFFPNPSQLPILKEALKANFISLGIFFDVSDEFVEFINLEREPVAFAGGVFAGLLRLDLKEEPLREWVARTVEASGITGEENHSKREVEEEEQVPQQIEIE